MNASQAPQLTSQPPRPQEQVLCFNTATETMCVVKTPLSLLDSDDPLTTEGFLGKTFGRLSTQRIAENVGLSDSAARTAGQIGGLIGGLAPF